MIFDLVVELPQAHTKLGGLDAGSVQDPAGNAGHAGHIKTEGLRALPWLELVQENNFVLCLIGLAGHVIELDAVVGSEFVKQHVIVRGEQ